MPSRVVQALQHVAKDALKSIPAVLLGLLLNVLDGVSYGILIFPTAEPYISLGLSSAGVSMFFVSCLAAQLVFSAGGSGFKGANGSMMIEVVPFFHILSSTIASEIGLLPGNERAIAATTLASYALSSILTGTTFLLLGSLKLGAIVGFFPRHILVGCIGGIGVFLIVTGLCISTGLEDTNFAYNMGTMRYLFFDTWNLMMWIVPFALAALLRIATSTLKMSLRAEQLIFPGYFVMIPAIFYVVVLAAKLDLHSLRADGWLFDVGGDEGKWYAFYEYFDFGKIHWKCLWSTMPTQLALLFFNILHPPLNVPALAVSLDEDVDTNKELTAHGFSNLFAGFLGTVPNYLVYVNTLLFYRVGGVTRVAGFMLALATVVLLLVGTQPIAYLPVMEVGALIFVLGIDLVKEALWDTRHRASRRYITIVSIMVCMTIWDFVIGVLFGIIASCVFFVVQNSQRRSIRSMEWGDTAMSTVRRPNTQRNYLREVSTQTIILRLQGFLFFGTINYVEDTIKQLSNTSSWQRNPLRFLVLDFSLVYGIDMSSAEAFVRIQRLLFSRGVTLVFCGFSGDSPVGRALAGVEVLGASGVELFSTFNDAIEWTENAYLRTWFKSQKDLTAFGESLLPGRQDAAIRHDEPINSFAASPRLSHMHNAGGRTMLMDVAPHAEVVLTTEEPFNTIYKTFSSYEDLDVNKLRPLKGYLKRKSLPAGHVLFRQNDPSDGLYLVQSGILRATYEFAPDPARSIVESMVPGTLAGELSALSGLPRNATVFVEQPAVVWWLSDAELRRMETQQPEMSRIFVRLVLKAAKIDTDILLSALASRQ
ncbi:hypothetical protein FISHEDRAFT_40530 [Fistulina hepatica ATCC 64428]|uniref:Sulfate transporter family protein n=1 Tax=Fistulina hepatica ATCC 64428 TaxID=1128425 RepID=A0A0D7AFJ7_9AGAR|nr:hypothetical protein FISHEDRAFT_40530 [Fistulina hepatica ATCC 64428]